MTDHNAVFLEPVTKDDIDSFCALMKDAFETSAVPSPPDSEMPPEDEVKEYFENPSGHVMWVLENGCRIGGAVVEADAEFGRNLLVWFFIAPDLHSRGLGTKAWRAIERHWPETRIWELGTPYCDKRNLNFYINKCGFHVVEFFNEHHPELVEGEDARCREESGLPEEDSFRFEKLMQP